MANTNAPYGLRPVGTMNSASYNGKAQKFYVPADNATAIHIGDTVEIAGTGSAQAVYPIDVLRPEVAEGTQADVHTLGVVVGIEPLYSDLSVNYRKASTAMYILVDTDPQTIYSVQGDSGTWTAEDVHLNANITVTAGSNTTGRSNFVITTPTADAAKDTLIIGVDPALDNETGAYMRFLVLLNLPQYGFNARTVGLT